MTMFITTLAVGAVAGFMMEQQWGINLVRWSRMQRMRARIAKRQGVSPWRAFFDEQE
jgi:cytochrome bd-type quinol oxidase subunit 1